MIGSRLQRLGWVLLAALLPALVGCGQNSGGSAGVTRADMRVVRAMGGYYAAYQYEHLGQSPPNEQAFRDYLSSIQDRLNNAGITVEQMFRSPRSDQPIVWVFGRNPPSDSRGVTYLAYEAEPIDGKRLAVIPRGGYELIDEAQFRSLFPDAR